MKRWPDEWLFWLTGLATCLGWGGCILLLTLVGTGRI